MDLRIQQIEPVSREKWLSICQSCDYATFFHTPQWADLFVGTMDTTTRLYAQLILFSDGVSAVFPCVKTTKAFGFVSVISSGAGGTYGGWISAERLSAEHVALLVKSIKPYRDLVLRENPFATYAAYLNVPATYNEHTHSIDLSGGFDGYWAATAYAHKKAIRKAEREGLCVRCAETKPDWHSYFEMYTTTIQRWKSAGTWSPRKPRYTAQFITKLLELPRTECRLWLVEYNGKIIAGIVCFYWNRHAVTWHAASDEAHFTLRPNNLLYHEIVRDACERGFHLLDLNPSGGFDKVESFKENLGAQPKVCRVINRTGWFRRIGELVRQRN